MAQNSNNGVTVNNVATIRITGSVALTHIINPESYQGQTNYEIGISNPQFEDPQTSAKENGGSPDNAQKAIASMKARVKPGQNGQGTVIWLRQSTQTRSGRANHIAYYDQKTMSQIPTSQEIGQGQMVTAVVNCTSSNALAMNNYPQYNGISGHLVAIIFPDASKVQWYNAGTTTIAGFKNISNEEAYGNGNNNANGAPAQPQGQPMTQQYGQPAQPQPMNQGQPTSAFTGKQGNPTQSNPFNQNNGTLNPGGMQGQGQPTTPQNPASGMPTNPVGGQPTTPQNPATGMPTNPNNLNGNRPNNPFAGKANGNQGSPF